MFLASGIFIFNFFSDNIKHVLVINLYKFVDQSYNEERAILGRYNLTTITNKQSYNKINKLVFLKKACSYIKWECCEVAFNILDPDVEVQ